MDTYAHISKDALSYLIALLLLHALHLPVHMPKPHNLSLSISVSKCHANIRVGFSEAYSRK